MNAPFNILVIILRGSDHYRSALRNVTHRNRPPHPTPKTTNESSPIAHRHARSPLFSRCLPSPPQQLSFWLLRLHHHTSRHGPSYDYPTPTTPPAYDLMTTISAATAISAAAATTLVKTTYKGRHRGVAVYPHAGSLQEICDQRRRIRAEVQVLKNCLRITKTGIKEMKQEQKNWEIMGSILGVVPK